MTAKSIFLRATEAGLAEAGSWELQRRLEAITSENSRIGNLGPALFVVICLLAAVILLCFFSGFIDKPGPRRAMQAGAVALIVIPALFFSMTSYVTDTSQILDKDNIDTTYKPRMLVFVFSIIILGAGVGSLFAGETAPLTMHRQGRNIYSIASAKGSGA